MVLEVAVLNVEQGETRGFEAAFKQAEGIIAASPGYVSHELKKCLEADHRYLLLVQWQTLEDHTVGFRGRRLIKNGERCCTIFTTRFRRSSTMLVFNERQVSRKPIRAPVLARSARAESL